MQSWQIRTFTTWDEIQSLQPLWTKLQHHPSAEYDFYRIVLQSRNNVESPCVFAYQENGAVLSLLVGRIERSQFSIHFGYAKLASFPARKLVLMDGGFMGQQTDVIWERLLLFVVGFLRSARITFANIENLPVNSSPFMIATQRLSWYQKHPAPPGKHWLLQLPKSFDEFMAARSKKRRYWLNRLPRVLDKDFPSQWEIIRYSTYADADLFAAAAEKIASQTYHRGLGVGFRANQEMLERLRLDARNSRLCSYVLFIKGEPCAFWHCASFGTTLHLASTGYRPAFASYEVGTVLLLRVIKDICGTHITTVDFGLGDAEYKQRYGTEYYEEASLLIFPRTLKSFLLSALKHAGEAINQLARHTLGALHLTQRLKKYWRRKKAATASPLPVDAEAEPETPSLPGKTPETAEK